MYSYFMTPKQQGNSVLKKKDFENRFIFTLSKSDRDVVHLMRILDLTRLQTL